MYITFEFNDKSLYTKNDSERRYLSVYITKYIVYCLLNTGDFQSTYSSQELEMNTI